MFGIPLRIGYSGVCQCKSVYSSWINIRTLRCNYHVLLHPRNTPLQPKNIVGDSLNKYIYPRAHRSYGINGVNYVSKLRLYSSLHRTKSPQNTSFMTTLYKYEDAIRLYGYSPIRVIFVAVIISGISVYIFWAKIRENVADEVSNVATLSLEDEALQLKAHELAVALLYTVFNDPKLQNQTVRFLRNVINEPQTQKAFTELFVRLFNEELIRENLTVLLKQVAIDSLKNEDFRECLSSNLKLLLADENTREGLSELLEQLLADKQLTDSFRLFMHDTLKCSLVKDQATILGKEVVAGVVKDPLIQKTTGDAIWSALGYTVTPRWFSKNYKVAYPPTIYAEAKETEKKQKHAKRPSAVPANPSFDSHHENL